MVIKPQTKLGKWSVGLNAFFLMIIVVSLILVFGLRALNFGDTWWDVTAIVFILPIIALVLGIIAIIKKENSRLVYISLFISLLDILFILLHSLFIGD